MTRAPCEVRSYPKGAGLPEVPSCGEGWPQARPGEGGVGVREGRSGQREGVGSRAVPVAGVTCRGPSRSPTSLSLSAWPPNTFSGDSSELPDVRPSCRQEPGSGRALANENVTRLSLGTPPPRGVSTRGWLGGLDRREPGARGHGPPPLGTHARAPRPGVPSAGEPVTEQTNAHRQRGI